jgi:pyridinium-3,5-bisthiocarboxylic acid mononucleotide nickel chelatase
MSRIGWLDLTNGVSGDMMLGALASAGVRVEVMADALRPLGLPITLRAEQVTRAGMAATRVVVDAPEQGQPVRRWREVRDILRAVAEPVQALAVEIFTALAQAEAHVHGCDPGDVHFHEVGALDAIADVVAAAAGFVALGLGECVVGPIALGGGTARSAHGLIPIPGPAVLALLRAAGAPATGGPDQVELATPTGVAIATTVATGYGPMSAMTPEIIGVGAGTRDPKGRPNVVRLVVGDGAEAGTAQAPSATVLEANIDDMDPRMWPAVLASLLAAGAGDAWLIPIAMKKGRPAHTLCAIVAAEHAEAVRAAIFTNTTTIGLREHAVAKHALRREFREVTIDGQLVSVKLGISPAGAVVNAAPEWEDVARVAHSVGRPVKQVLAEAVGLAAELTSR